MSKKVSWSAEITDGTVELRGDTYSNRFPESDLVRWISFYHRMSKRYPGKGYDKVRDVLRDAR